MAAELHGRRHLLARPWPLAVVPEVEYELEQDGKAGGLFDIRNAGQQMGSWVGFRSWKPMPAAHPKTDGEGAREGPAFDDDDAQSQRAGFCTASIPPHLQEDRAVARAAETDAGGQAQQPSDPDRPVLHKKDSGRRHLETAERGPAPRHQHFGRRHFGSERIGFEQSVDRRS